MLKSSEAQGCLDLTQTYGTSFTDIPYSTLLKINSLFSTRGVRYILPTLVMSFRPFDRVRDLDFEFSNSIRRDIVIFPPRWDYRYALEIRRRQNLRVRWVSRDWSDDERNIIAPGPPPFNKSHNKLVPVNSRSESERTSRTPYRKLTNGETFGQCMAHLL